MDVLVNSGKMVCNRKQGFLFQQRVNALGFRWIVVFMLVFSFVIQVWAGLCPPGCQCENKGLSTLCPAGELKHIPHFLNPAIRQLKVNGNKITKLEGALNFYDKVIFEFFTPILFDYIYKCHFYFNRDLYFHSHFCISVGGA